MKILLDTHIFLWFLSGDKIKKGCLSQSLFQKLILFLVGMIRKVEK